VKKGIVPLLEEMLVSHLKF